MASWTDGAEYAPTERPDGFATPRAAPLDHAPAEVHLAKDRPVDHPAGFQPSGPAPSLESLGVPTGPTRDPNQSFGTVTTAMTTSAWGSTHSSTTTLEAAFDPRAPMTAGAPQAALATLPPPAGAPVAPAQYPPPQNPATAYPEPQNPATAYSAPLVSGEYPAQYDAMGQPLRGAGKVVAWAQFLVRQVTVPMVVVLALGLVIPQVAFVTLVLAIPLATRLPRFGVRLRTVAGIAAPVALMLAFVWNIHDEVTTSLGTWSRLGALATLAYAVYLAWPRAPRQP